MSIDFKVPELGENVHSGDLVNVLVCEGQTIETNQSVVEIETDKAVIELPCPHAGQVTKVHVKKGDTVKVGQTLLTIDPAAVKEAAPATTAQAGAAKRQAADETAAQPSPVPPQAAAVAAAPAATGVSPATGAAPARKTGGAGPQPSVGGPIPAGPAARRVARELGVDLGQLSGSGQRGRITPEDVRAAAAEAPAAPVRTPAGLAAPSPQPVVPPGEPGQDAWGPVRRERMSQIRRTIAAHMSKSASTIPHVTNFDDADITDLERLRKGVPDGYLGANLKLTLMPFVLKGVANALARHPMLNASLDEDNGQIVYKQYVHLGVAVDTPRGLVVPVMRNVDRMSIPEIARALTSIAERARQAQFTLEELRGGTFTLSNLGAVGGTYSTPIINHPEVAVLLLGRSRWLPMVRAEKIEPRLMFPLSLSYDHRLVDGATAGRFLNDLIDQLQSPGKLLLGG